MRTLKEWTDRNARRPLAAAFLGILALQVAYLGFLAYLQYAACSQRADRIVETAALGIDQENRPLIESALTSGLRSLDAQTVALCRNGETYLIVPPKASDPCRPSSSKLRDWIITRAPEGRQGYLFVFVLDRLAPLKPLVGILISFGLFLPVLAFVLIRAQRKFEAEVLQPLCRGLDDDQQLEIKELEDLRLRGQALVALNRKQAASEALVSLASQVAHDIRSPLVVLEAASSAVSGVPDEQRQIIRRASSHIRDIADGLLSRYGAIAASTTRAEPGSVAGTPVMLAAVLDAVTAEKRVQYRDRASLVIESSPDEHSYGLFARVDATDLRRVLSNLINNAVESLVDGAGRVDIDLMGRAGRALIVVRDNGRGIPADVLARLGTRGATYGKAGGSGLGLAHAKSCAQAWGGTVSLDSVVGRGTTVTLTLPLSSAPRWFAPQIVAPPCGTVVILDDDASIHQVWRKRFSTAQQQGDGVELVHAFNPEDLRRWVSKHPAKARNTRFLLDYHLMGYSDTGLDLAEGLGIAANAVLVTSAHDEPGVVDRCERLGMKLVPKSLASLVAVRVSRPASSKQEMLDAVLIDDESLLRNLWKGAAKSCGKRFEAFATAEDFLEACGRIDRRTPIYIDHILGELSRGEDVAVEIRRLGFQTIYLATGQSPELFAGMPWITKVVGKSAPWRTSDSTPEVVG